MQRAPNRWIAATTTVLIIATLPNQVVSQEIDLRTTESISMVPVTKTIQEARGLGDEGGECWDTWWAGGGPIWYTPEKYAFCPGDTATLVTFIHLEGPTDNLRRTDAFYRCGETNPFGYVMTTGTIDFGPMPENSPGYGWIVGVGYVVPDRPGISIDSASRLSWNGIFDCGIPLSGPPPCITIEDCD
ncbi:MAG: hypothetical protein CME06_12375 [Gemmatimonadetes bacterium]|nr:hypothetical protein [Gemmatimonadota bacterium]